VSAVKRPMWATSANQSDVVGASVGHMKSHSKIERPSLDKTLMILSEPKPPFPPDGLTPVGGLLLSPILYTDLSPLRELVAALYNK